MKLTPTSPPKTGMLSATTNSKSTQPTTAEVQTVQCFFVFLVRSTEFLSTRTKMALAARWE